MTVLDAIELSPCCRAFVSAGDEGLFCKACFATLAPLEVVQVVPFQAAQTIGALSIEVNTGMRHSQGSVLRLVQQRYGVKARTKKAALAEMREIYKAATGREYGS